MSKQKTRSKIVSSTANKVIVKVDEAKKVLPQDEWEFFEYIIEKLRKQDIGGK